MSSKQRLGLMVNDVVGTQSDGAPLVWRGGDGTLFIQATTWGGGNAKLEMLSPDGVTWLGLQNAATITPINATANGTANFQAPEGRIRINVTTATGVSAWVVQSWLD